MTDQHIPAPAVEPEQPSPVPQPSMPLPATGETTIPPRRRRKYVIAGAAAAALAFTVGGVALATADRQSALEAARATCGATSDDYAKVGDDGNTLTLRSVGEESSGLTLDQLECYWAELDMPDSVRAEVNATRALDGRQSAEWNDVHASWSYHPDSGVQMVFTLAD